MSTENDNSDVIIKVRVVPAEEDSDYVWRAYSPAYPKYYGYGDDVNEALDNFAEEIRKAYTVGQFKTDKIVSVGCQIKSVTAEVSMKVMAETPLSKFGIGVEEDYFGESDTQCQESM